MKTLTIQNSAVNTLFDANGVSLLDASRTVNYNYMLVGLDCTDGIYGTFACVLLHYGEATQVKHTQNVVEILVPDFIDVTAEHNLVIYLVEKSWE